MRQYSNDVFAMGVDYYPIYGYNNIKQIEPYMRALYARDGKYLKKEKIDIDI